MGGELALSLQLGLIYGLVAVGVFLTFRVLNFADMTCDGSFMVGGCVASMLLRNGFSPALAVLGAGCGGAFTGCGTAFLHLRFRISDILAGILIAFMAYSINLRILGGMPNLTLSTDPGRELLLAACCCAVLLAFGYLLGTDFGLAFRSVGQNRELASSQHISVKTALTFGLAAGNGCVAMGGAFFCLTQGFYDVGSGSGTLIVGLASLVIGEAILPFRSPWIRLLACFLGSIAYRLAVGFALHSDMPFLRPSDFNLLTAALIILTLALRRRKGPCCA
ncbi:MAG: ABC transporter permease [Puniceicoccales bacterium]|jgi:putative ABC transport system permease protein|nr:ABC transporter permease [Puniceicoccales bacterium]